MEAEAMTGTTKNTALDLLREGRDLIAAGWMQDGYAAVINGQTCYCAMGALGQGMGEIHPYQWAHAEHVENTYTMATRSDATRLLAHGFGADFGEGVPVAGVNYVYEIVDANDDAGATQASVLAAFDAAILLASATPAVQA
jgi:hypothetical protein